MKYIKTALLAGVLASASTAAFAQFGAATEGVNMRSVHNTPYARSVPARKGTDSYAYVGAPAGVYVDTDTLERDRVKGAAMVGGGITFR